MALPPLQTTSPLSNALRHRAELLDTMYALQRVLAVPATQPDWATVVGVRLRALQSAFAEHVQLTEGSDGLYAELLEHAPRLAYRVGRLVRDHDALASNIEALCSRTGSAAPDELRGRSANLLRELFRHRQRGADLVYDAYSTDIGGET
ncbi:MAG TPA: hypothetical protein VJT31_03560 [Rugosimonospora sp.]|nr:hypothetical protein [Rugosimonospora sp.]